ncbi:MAG: methionine gamma-lyase family protein [Acidaminobacteraceae bacterium]
MNKRDYYKRLGIDEKVMDLADKVEASIKDKFEEISSICEFNQLKVLDAFQKNRLSDHHFSWNTGYGYDDSGRETMEKVFADIFAAEDSIVRPLIVNGTHALTLSLTGILRPGDTMLSITGKPYDTLEEVIGISGEAGNGSLMEFGINYRQIDLDDKGSFKVDEILSSIDESTKMLYIQRSGGYSFRKALTIFEIEDIISKVRTVKKDIIVMVDNCYGEFLDYKEPTEVGADIMAGSLIKNPGGGLALSGGYIVGRADLIKLVSYRMTSPGIGKECGLTFGQTRSIFQGLFMAPSVVSGALKGAIFCSKLYETLGYEVSPTPDDYRSDIIQSVKLGTKEKVVAFCEGIQSAAPVDSYVTPIPWAMPGYNSEVIMAAGAFVQGSSIELSADAPIKEPFVVYFQGGLTYEHSKFGAIKSLNRLVEKELQVL